jgi:GT2 family glycosyltransferase
MKEAVLLIACYNGRGCIGECIHSLIESNDEGVQLRIIVADNASGDGSADFVAGEFPGIDVVRLSANGGFTGGINAAWEHAKKKYPEAAYVGIVNQDIVARAGWLAAMVEHLEANPRVGAVQPKVLLWPEKDRFNTAGNRSHFLGFGLVSAYGRVDDGSLDQVREIDFPSGAATVMRREALGDGGLLEDRFFLYLEDAELGWRLRQSGFEIHYVPGGAVWHKYEYRHDYRYYFFLERNRWYLLAMYYRFATLVLISPAIVAMELGQFYFAWRNGVLGQKFRAYAEFLAPANLSETLRRRRAAQKRRRIGDRKFTRHFVGEVELPELKSRVLRMIGNPLMNAYWQVARRMILW